MATLIQNQTNASTLLQMPRMGDLILMEERGYFSRRVCQVAPSQTLFFGQVLQGDPVAGQVSALGADVDTVGTLTFVDNGSGTSTTIFDINVNGISTGDIAYSATINTLVAHINTALLATFGGDTTNPNVVAAAVSGNISNTVNGVVSLTFENGYWGGQPNINANVEVTGQGASTTLVSINNGATAGAAVANVVGQLYPIPLTVSATAGGAGVNQVNTFNITGSVATTDTLGFIIGQPNGEFWDITAPCTNNYAAWLTAINTAIEVAYAAAGGYAPGTTGLGPVVSGTAYTGIVLTWSGTMVAAKPIREDVELDTTGVAASTIYTNIVSPIGAKPTGMSGASCILLYDGYNTNVALSSLSATTGRPTIVTGAGQSLSAVCLVRHALVKPGYLLFAPSIMTGVEAVSIADKRAALFALENRGIVVETGPNYTTSPDGSFSGTT